MSRLATLTARVARVERALQPRALPSLCFTLFDRNEAVTGFSGPSGAVVERMPGELFQTLVARARAIIGASSTMWATYPQSVWDEPEVMPPEVEAMGWSEPEPVAPDPAFPWHLSGIGRIATDEELAKMGVAPRRR